MLLEKAFLQHMRNLKNIILIGMPGSGKSTIGVVLAEHILILGYQPVGTMKEFIENSSIQEAGNEKIKTLNIVEELIHDLQILKQKSIQIKQEAENKCNYETSTLMDDYLTNYSKKIWMLNETLK